MVDCTSEKLLIEMIGELHSRKPPSFGEPFTAIRIDETSKQANAEKMAGMAQSIALYKDMRIGERGWINRVQDDGRLMHSSSAASHEDAKGNPETKQPNREE